MRRRSLAWLPLAGLLFTDGEILLPGQEREHPIAAEEAHVYSLEMADAPLLVTVEQRGIDLVVEARGPAGQEALTAATLNGRWGLEVLVLPAGAVGSYRVEVRPRQGFVPEVFGTAGRYTIGVEVLAQTTEEEARRAAAMTAMSHAGQLAPGPPEAKRQALAAYHEALAIWRALNELRWEAEALYAIAFLELELNEPRPAIEAFLRVLAIWRELAEPHREAAALIELGSAYLRSGENEKARKIVQSSLALWQRLGERFDEGLTRLVLCYLEQLSGAIPAALACHEGVRAYFRELGDPSLEVVILNNLGGIYDALGEPDAALSHLERSLVLRRTLGDRRGEALTLSNIGNLYVSLGEWQEALRIHGQAWEIQESLGDRDAKLLSKIGKTYSSLGEPQRALAFLEDALKLHRKAGNQPWEIGSLNLLGSTWRGLGDLKRALDYHRQALELAMALKDTRSEAVTRLYLAEIQLDKGDPSTALRELGPALVYLRETGLRHEEAQALDLQGRALALAGRARESLPVLQEALVLHRALRDRAGEAETLSALAAAERSLGFHGEARAHAEAAVTRVEELRTGFVSPNLRAAFLAAQRRAYSLLIDLLMDRHAANPGGGHDRAALAVSEQARARNLLDALHSGSTRSARGTAAAELLERRESLHRRLSAKSDQQLKQGGEKAEALRREIEALLAELDRVEAEIQRRDPRYAALREPQPLGVEGISALLDPGTLLLEYSLGEERSFLWVLGPGSFRSFVLPPQREIEALARQYYEELSTAGPGAGRQPDTAETLSRILLGPVWSDAARFHRLVVVPDAALHVIPFGALPVPDPGRTWEAPGAHRPLLEHQEVVYLPSATTLGLQRQGLERRAPAPKQAAILADPVFGPGETAGGLLPQFDPLPSSRREAEAIARLVPTGQAWTALGLEASRNAVLSGKLKDYRVLHFATHGIADTRTPELSGLVLSLVDAAGRPQEGFLGLSDIYELDLTADLVVLSGCRTALGKEIQGEGLMGLTRGFLYAGASRVVASLWRVQDRTTAELMSRFYRAMWRNGLSPAAALREAQRSLSREPRYRDPYSWAGFVLQGDWR